MSGKPEDGYGYPVPAANAAASVPLTKADLDRIFTETAGSPLGRMMHSLLRAPEQPGTPYVHTFAPPEPIGQDEDGNDIYPPPGPAYTLTEDG